MSAPVTQPGSAVAPGPRARFPGQHLLALQRDPLAFLTRVAREHGDIARFRLGRQEMWLLSHPDHVRDVLVTSNRLFVKGRALDRAKLLLGEGLLTSNGDFHLRQRRLAQPAFHRQRIAGYARDMVELAQRHRDRWRHGETLDVARAMNRLTLAIAGRTLFGADVEGEAEEIGRALTDAIALFEIARLPIPESLLNVLVRLPVGSGRRLTRARARLDATVYRMIADRRTTGADRGDLLSMLLLATDTEGDGSGMSDQQLRDEVLTIFLAGHETTANALAWTLHLLGRDPDAEHALHEEIDRVLGGRAPAGDDLSSLPWTRAVFAEAMRLYPPAWVIGRRALRPYEVGGHTVPADALVLVSQWVVHRDPRWWPDAGRFEPARWLATEPDPPRPRLAYFPFGAGPRQCIGEQFAWTEAILVLATIVQRWRLRPIPGVEPVKRPMITLRMEGGTEMRLERR